jgi:hypothetical protein
LLRHNPYEKLLKVAMSTATEPLKAYERGLEEFRQAEKTLSKPESQIPAAVLKFARLTRATLEQNGQVIQALQDQNTALTKQVSELRRQLVATRKPETTLTADEAERDEPMFFSHIREAWTTLRHSR